VKQVRFLISGGGTGGHIFPAISIANELSDRIKNSKIEFVGAKNTGGTSIWMTFLALGIVLSVSTNRKSKSELSSDNPLNILSETS